MFATLTGRVLDIGGGNGVVRHYLTTFAEPHEKEAVEATKRPAQQQHESEQPVEVGAIKVS